MGIGPVRGALSTGRCLAVAVVLTACLIWAPAASGATITPNVTGDQLGGNATECSLREAVQAANTNAAFDGCPAGDPSPTLDLISLTITYTLQLSGVDDANNVGDLDVSSSDLAFVGTGVGHREILVSGAQDRVLHVHSGVTGIQVSNVELRNGNSTFVTARPGGAILNEGAVTVTDSALNDSLAGTNGGGIAHASTATSTSLTNVTVSNDGANASGGGIAHNGGAGTLTLNNVTVTDNRADFNGGGGGAEEGGGIFGPATLANTIVAGNNDPIGGAPDCSGTLTSQGHNLIGTLTGCTFTPTTGDQTGVSANLGTLRDNGGSSRTHVPNRGSPAIDAGNPATPDGSAPECATTDQRGFGRAEGPCDIGAVEVRARTIAPADATDEFNTNVGHCSLREAVQSANVNGGFSGCAGGADHDTVSLPPGTYNLTLNGVDDANAQGDLDITGPNLLLTAEGPGQTAIDGAGGGDRVIDVVGMTPIVPGIEISGLVIRNGSTPQWGGGVRNFGSLTLRNSTVQDNFAGNFGGGVANVAVFDDYDVDLTVINSTISGNRTDGDGGGIGNGEDSNSTANTTLANATITNNTADDDASGMAGGGGVSNLAPNGIVFLRNTIVAGNADDSGGDAPDCDVLVNALTSEGYSLLGNITGCTWSSATGDILGMPASLGPLADNGGTSLTHGLLPGSLAIDAGNPAAPGSGGTACQATDQRGIARPAGSACDMGAFEGTLAQGGGGSPPSGGQPPAVIPTPTSPPPAKKKCKKGRKLKKGKCVKKRKKKA